MINRSQIIVFWTNLCRFILAGVFILSGFVKMVDPIGMQYKLTDYLTAFGIADYAPSWFVLNGAMALGIAEFVLGAYFLFGIRRKISTTLALFFMCIMTPLTLYIALYDPVPDCGCFGDAIILTNVQTFLKNLVLLVLVVSTYKYSHKIRQWSTDRFQWLISLYVLGFALVLSWYNLKHLPVWDFRPFAVGVDIEKAMTIPEGEKPNQYEVRFLMEKEGVQKEFTIENYPDSTWQFVSRRDHLVKKGYEPSILDFSLLSVENNEEVTDDLLSYEGYTFLLVTHNLEEADESNIDVLNDVYDYCVMHQYRFYALTASDLSQIKEWRYNTGADYPFLLGDDIMLKTVIRSNPGLVLLKDGVIYNKWSNSDIPTEYELNRPLQELDMAKRPSVEKKVVIQKIVGWFFIPLLLLCILDGVIGFLHLKRKQKREK